MGKMSKLEAATIPTDPSSRATPGGRTTVFTTIPDSLAEAEGAAAAEGATAAKGAAAAEGEAAAEGAAAVEGETEAERAAASEGATAGMTVETVRTAATAETTSGGIAILIAGCKISSSTFPPIFL